MNAPHAPGWHPHAPVMLAEVLALFEPLRGSPLADGVMVDATVGGGGHADAMLDAHPGLRLVGLDQDADAVREARRRLASYGPRAMVVHRRFDHMEEALDELGIDEIAGVIFDLGVSSHQFDEPGRGFSYRQDGPLDMRMDVRRDVSAATIVNLTAEEELIELLRRFGDEPNARRIAKAVVAGRPVTTTGQLAELVASAVPAAARRRGHPARRTFQALRIAANEELTVLAPALEGAIGRLAAGGRGVVLTYHSGEDRIVKRVLRRESMLPAPPRPGLPPPPGPPPRLRLINPGGQVPSAAEVAANPRAKSARARAFVRQPETAATGLAS